MLIFQHLNYFNSHFGSLQTIENGRPENVISCPTSKLVDEVFHRACSRDFCFEVPVSPAMVHSLYLLIGFRVYVELYNALSLHCSINYPLQMYFRRTIIDAIPKPITMDGNDCSILDQQYFLQNYVPTVATSRGFAFPFSANFIHQLIL